MLCRVCKCFYSLVWIVVAAGLSLRFPYIRQRSVGLS